MAKPKSKIAGSAKEVLSEKTKEVMRLHEVDVDTSTHNEYAKEKYSRKNERQKLIFTRGRDLLQFNIVVRPYIIRKHRLNNQTELDVLLYLFPIQYFTKRDFNALPVKNEGYHMNTLMELGFVEVIVKHHSKVVHNLYGLSDRAKKIVKEYYEYLSGEKSVNPNGTTNPFNDKDATKVDGIRQKLLNKLTHQTKTQPKLYRKSFYQF